MVIKNKNQFMLKSWDEIVVDIPELSKFIYPIKSGQFEGIINHINSNNPYKKYMFVGPVVVISSAFFLFKKQTILQKLLSWF